MSYQVEHDNYRTIGSPDAKPTRPRIGIKENPINVVLTSAEAQKDDANKIV